jgi:transposase
MRKIREILRLRAAGFTDQEVAASIGCARSTVQECLRRARAGGIDWPPPEELDEAALEARLYPRATPVRPPSAAPEPDFAYIARELTRKHVTRRQLWREYHAQHPQGLKYTAFCVHFQRWRATAGAEVTLAQEHQPGEHLFVDYGGDPAYLTDRHTGEQRPVWLFVAAWGFSHLLYVEATATQQSADWLTAHVNALEAFGCAPHAIVPDNTTTAVRRALRYDPQLNPEYRDFAEQYSIAVLPARVRKPRDKAKVESAVLISQRRVLAALRDAVFFSLADLNAAIRAIVAEINAEPFQKREGTRRELFERYERPAAQALPARRYEYAEWRTSLVHRDHHIEVARGYYSVPYTLVGQRVDVRVGAHLIEIFQHGMLIAAHARVERPYQRRTIQAHRPAEHRAYLALGFDQLLDRAQKIGPHTAAVLARQALHKRHLGETLRGAQGILRLAQDFTPQALEQAAGAALTLGVFSYRAVRDLLLQASTASGTPSRPAVADIGQTATATGSTDATSAATEHENVRGAKYFH